MHNYLLVVESPAKAKTIAGYLSGLPDRWRVMATRGHLVDLPKARHGVHQEAGHFIPEWELSKEKSKMLNEIKAAASQSDGVFVACDADREGEKISADIIKYAKVEFPQRITFTEVTPDAIKQAILEGVRPVEEDKVSAQVARRIVDREIGYPVSSVIHWDFQQKKRPYLPKGVGRVISPALHILCETEQAIESYVPETYDRIAIDYIAHGKQFRLTSERKFTKDEGEERDDLLEIFNKEQHIVYNYERKTRDITPYSPLVTSRMQRCAFYLHGFEPEYTMRLAQQLYEGIEISVGRRGLISYPRTDSYQLSDKAVADMVGLLTSYYSEQYVLTEKRDYKDKSNTQGAHEAIRPASFDQSYWPKNIQKYLEEDQYKLYEMIWYRTLATQMKSSIYDASVIEMDVGGVRLKGQANERIFDGWERLDGNRAEISERSEVSSYRYRKVTIPNVDIGSVLDPIEIQSFEHTTKSPSRYGIGRFISYLDNRGIARPSTLDTIVRGLVNKGYVDTHKGMIYVSSLGRDVDKWSSDNVPWLNETDHAKEFEEELDAVERGEVDVDQVISKYKVQVDALKSALNFVAYDERPPSDAQQQLATRLAEENGVTISAGQLQDRKWIRSFLDKEAEQGKKIGKCISCGEEEIWGYRDGFTCRSKSCHFRLKRSRVEHFIKNFHLEIEDVDEFVKRLLKRKKTLVEGLKGKNEKIFDAYLGIEYDEQYKNWKIEIKGFPRNNRNQEE
ncbi:MAG: type I DNA topoisomerase [Bacteroidetes bacterium]|nr:type I DNA topoisomerase [Bacteroidota bacterium]